MPIEVDDDVAELGGLMKRLLASDARQTILEAAHKVDPNLPIPEVTAKKYADAQDAELRKENQALKERLDKLEQMNGIQATRVEMKKKLGVDDATFERIEKTMVEKGIAKHESAFEFLKNADQVAAPKTPATFNGGPAKMPELSKEFLSNPVQGARELAHAIVDKRA